MVDNDNNSNKIEQFYIDNFKSKNMKLLNYYCIETLLNYLDPLKYKEPLFPKEFNKNIEVGLFVTWLDETANYRRRLRGCIGNFDPQPLEQRLKEYTIISSQEDKRFKSVSIDELENFSMSVSILYPFEDTKDIYDWEIGTHGVYCMFSSKGKKFSSCYLPEVPIIDSWDKKLTLERCVKKSGYCTELGKLDEVSDKMKIYKFKSVKQSVKYKDYLEFIKESENLKEV